jgi:hypothetical protein
MEIQRLKPNMKELRARIHTIIINRVFLVCLTHSANCFQCSQQPWRALDFPGIHSNTVSHWGIH